MFTTANGFHLALTIQPVNSPTTFLFRTTLSSWCNSLPVSLTVLVMNPTYLIFSLLLILLLILLNSFLLWVHPITFLFPYLVLSLQDFRKSGFHLRRGDVCGTSVLLTGLTCSCTSLISHAMIIAFVGRVPQSMLRVSPRCFSLAWRLTFHILFLLLNLTNLGLTQLVLALSTVGMLPSEITVVFKLLKLIQFIFHPEILQNLFFEIPKTLLRCKCNNISDSSSSRPFWHFAKN